MRRLSRLPGSSLAAVLTALLGLAFPGSGAAGAVPGPARATVLAEALPEGAPLPPLRVLLPPDPALPERPEHARIVVIAPGELALVQAASGATLARVEGGVRLLFRPAAAGIAAVALRSGTEEPLAFAADPLAVEAARPGEPVGIPSLARPGQEPYPRYRGRLEVARGPGGGLILVNVVDTEEYLRGVVPNEMPPTFALEALKAQAVAARGYALANLGRGGAAGADVCDGPPCQTYLGVPSEHPLADRAVRQTEGLVALHEGAIIRAVYFSTAAGHTESAENAWSDQAGRFPGQPVPYLAGVPDRPGAGPFSGEETARRYLAGPGLPGDFDRHSRHYRWREEWTREELEALLPEGLARRSLADPGFVSPPFLAEDAFGELRDLRVTARGVSGRAMALEVVTSEGRWLVRKELNIRHVLAPRGGGLLRSAAFVLDLHRDGRGRLVGVTAHGAGAGHGVGMSQWGAHGMALEGFSFLQILKHYFLGIEVGTAPFDLAALPRDRPLELALQVPAGRGALVVEAGGAGRVRVGVGPGALYVFDFSGPGRIRQDVSSHLSAGENRLLLYAPDPPGLRAQVHLAVGEPP